MRSSSSSPTAHWTALTRLLRLYTYGTTPQPVSFSTSMFPHFLPVSSWRRCCHGPSAVIVIGVPEQDGAGVRREARVCVEVVGDGRSLGAHRRPVVAAVGVELEVRQVRAPPLQDLHRLDGGRRVARHPQVVRVEVQGVRQPEAVDDLGQRRDDLRGRDVPVALDRVEEAPGVLAPLPGGHAAGVHGLDPVGLRGPDQPGHDVAGALHLPRFQEIHDDLVVGHEEEARLVEDAACRGAPRACAWRSAPAPPLR